ncbi:MAG: MFS transporter [Thermomicrobia bacterium]|nr:MFS transporter [Thermomicrobia bacterium]MCA1723383.1 MFS transporter [Thermomicrobia bacterium]
MTPFRLAAFRWLWCSTTASAGAQTMERTTTAWLALQAGGGAFAVGLVFAARSLPSLLFGLAAGTIADRTDRRRQLLVVAGVAVALMATIGVLVEAGTIRIWQVIAISFAAGCLQVSDTPARQALVLDTTPREAAPNAMALNALAARLSGAIGAIGAGVLIPLIGVAHCYFVIAAAYGCSAVLVAALRVPQGSRVPVVHPPFGRALRDALRLITAIPAVRTLTISGIACEIFAFSFGSALPVVARDVLRAGPEGLGTLNAATSVGGTVALVLLSILAGRVRREPLIGAIFVAYGASLMALAATRDLRIAAAVLVVTGLCAGAFDVLQQTLIQMAVPEEQRGRAVGIWVLGVGSAPVGNLEMGALIATLGAPSALLINGALAVASAGALLARAPGYRWRLRARPGGD